MRIDPVGGLAVAAGVASLAATGVVWQGHKAVPGPDSNERDPPTYPRCLVVAQPRFGGPRLHKLEVPPIQQVFLGELV